MYSIIFGGVAMEKNEIRNRLKFRIAIILVLIFAIGIAGCRKTVVDKYPTGKPRMEQTFKGNKLDGVFRMWYESGVIQQQAEYKSDLLQGPMIRWYANGVKEAEEMFSSGKKNGKASYWDIEGNLIEIKNFRNDTLHGEYRYWFASGLPKIEGNYHQGFYDGKWVYFNETGVRVGEGDFKMGSGVLLGFDPRGWKSHMVTYKDNLREGEEIRYNNKGEVVERTVYNKDKVIETSKVK